MRPITMRVIAALGALLITLTAFGLGGAGASATVPAPAAKAVLPAVLKVGTEGVYPPIRGSSLTMA